RPSSSTITNPTSRAPARSASTRTTFVTRRTCAAISSRTACCRRNLPRSQPRLAMPSPQLQSLIAMFEAARAAPGEALQDQAAAVAAYRKGTDDCLVLDGVAPQIGATTRVEAVDVEGVPCEWLLAVGADSDRRLLWIHGGGWIAGTL